MRSSRSCALGALALLVMAGAVFAQYAIDWSTIDGGGGTSTGGGYEIKGTVGQPDATTAYALTGGSYQLTGGFWGVALPACNTFVAPDFDHDCDVDLDDFERFEACSTADSVPYNPVSLPPGCTFTPSGGLIAPDFDGDGDVDLRDFAVYQRCASGSNVPATPGCDS